MCTRFLTLLLPLSLLFLLPHPPPPSHTHTEAVVLYDYEKQRDDELSLKMGDVILDVGEQVCVASELQLYTSLCT